MLNHYFVLSINHNTISAKERSKLPFNGSFIDSMYKNISKKDLKSLVCIETCNRFEIYGRGNVDKIIEYIKLLISEEEYNNYFKLYINNEAKIYMYRVASGIESQIIGDFQILMQFKEAFKKAKELKFLDGHFEKFGNSCIFTAKQIKNKTKITNGTASHSYAAVMYLNKLDNLENKRILLIGAGNFAMNIALNINTYIKNVDFTICNRSYNKAKLIVDKIKKGKILPFEDLNTEIESFDIIISAINIVDKYILDLKNLKNSTKKRIIIDMSVPYSINPEVKNLTYINYINIDDLSLYIQNNINKRKEDIPKAMTIISEHLRKFDYWERLAYYSDELEYKINNNNNISLENITSQSKREITRKFVKYINPIEKNIETPDIVNSFLKHYHLKENFAITER